MAGAELEVLREIRDLLTLIAEPQLEQRDKKLRSELKRIAGQGEKKIKAILLMDGSRSQKEISDSLKLDKGALSRLVKELSSAKLLKSDGAKPELALRISQSFFTEDKK